MPDSANKKIAFALLTLFTCYYVLQGNQFLSMSLKVSNCFFCLFVFWFSLYTNSKIEREEFMKVMHLMHAHNRQAAAHSDGLRAGHRLGGLLETGGVLEYFFGKDGKKSLKHDEFVSFVSELHDEVCIFPHPFAKRKLRVKVHLMLRFYAALLILKISCVLTCSCTISHALPLKLSVLFRIPSVPIRTS